MADREIQIDGITHNIPEGYKYIAQDSDSDICIYKLKPYVSDPMGDANNMWLWEGASCWDCLGSAKPIFGLNWEDSLMTIEEFIERSKND